MRRSSFFQTLFKASLLSIAIVSVSPAEVIANSIATVTDFMQHKPLSHHQDEALNTLKREF
ncbi:MAG: hypothetical protein IE937_06950 [Gammaproteobacteria bacterium]|jgi:hypothetical protein|nr:hypothetical protein [Gammaproteobacteria bacterium]MBD3777043.1 hypothetical protein [Thiotrichales bacterium]